MKSEDAEDRDESKIEGDADLFRNWDGYWERHNEKLKLKKELIKEPLEEPVEEPSVAPAGNELTLGKLTRAWLWVLVWGYGAYAVFSFALYFVGEGSENIITLLIMLLLGAEIVLMLKGKQIGLKLYVKTVILVVYRVAGSLVLMLLSIGLFAHALMVLPFIEAVIYLLHAGTRGFVINVLFLVAPALVTWALMSKNSAFEASI